jgi:transposase-like protein
MQGAAARSLMTTRSAFRFLKTREEIVCLTVRPYVRLPLALRNVKHLRHERGLEFSHETMRVLVNRAAILPLRRLVRIGLTAPFRLFVLYVR